MKKIIIVIMLSVISYSAFSQEDKKDERIQYVIDNIPVIEEPGPGEGSLSRNDVDELKVITNKTEIENSGYKNTDKIIIIITKEYKNRPDSLRKIPSTKMMKKRDGIWYLADAEAPYSGRFIDYYWNGKKQGEGILKAGLVNGLRTLYYANGVKSYFRNYINGVANGYSEEYFPDGKLKQKGSFVDGLDDGLWVDYYSTGVIKRQMTFKDKKPVFAKDEEKFYNLLGKSKDLMKDEDYKAAIKKLDDALKINSNYSDLYFYRGTAELDNYDFDAAILDLDKAVLLEPLYMEAISNRAFARIRKYQFKNSRTLSKNSDVTILAVKDKVEIPKEEKDKICADLNKGYELGDKKDMITAAIKEFCTN